VNYGILKVNYNNKIKLLKRDSLLVVFLGLSVLCELELVSCVKSFEHFFSSSSGKTIKIRDKKLQFFLKKKRKNIRNFWQMKRIRNNQGLRGQQTSTKHYEKLLINKKYKNDIISRRYFHLPIVILDSLDVF
jgi:hypothetical protein